MQKAVKGALALVFLLFLAACSLPRGAALQSEITRASDDPAASFQVVAVSRSNVDALGAWPVTGWHGHYHWLSAGSGPASQVIRPGDKIVLTIWDSDESSLLTGVGQPNAILPEMTVTPGGAIFVPYVDEVRVRGLTPDAARRRVQEALLDIAPSAQVQLSHTPGRQSAVDAVRGVASPGSYPLPDRNVSILSLISLAGGISTDLRNPLVRLIRGTETYEIRAGTLLEDARRNIILQGGDKIIVDEDDRTFVALGATGREERVFFAEETLTTLEALAIVGGLSEARADLEGLLILRQYESDDLAFGAAGPEKAQVVFTFDLTSAEGLFAARNFEVNPDDVVVATESPVTSAQTILGLLGSALGVGRSAGNI